MRVLAIDTSLGVCAAAIFDSEIDAVVASEVVAMERGHAEGLMPQIVRVMDRARLDFAALDRIAVTVGPGSFTGLRVGVAAARGIALAASKVAVGVSTLAAFAAPCIADDLSDLTLAAIDARHGHVYAQVFGEGGRTLVAARHMSAAEAVRLVDAPVHLTGSAMTVLREEWPSGRAPPLGVRSGPAPSIEWVARLGTAAVAEFAPARPLYLRPPDAQPQHGARLARQ